MGSWGEMTLLIGVISYNSTYNWWLGPPCSIGFFYEAGELFDCNCQLSAQKCLGRWSCTTPYPKHSMYMVYLLTFSIKTLTIHGSVNIPYYNTLSVWVCLQSIFLERFSENMGSNEKELPEKDSLTYGILPQRSTEKALSEGVRVFFLGRGGFYIKPVFFVSTKKSWKNTPGFLGH